MTITQEMPKRTKFSLWLQAARPFAYSASIVPVLVGAMIALADGNPNANWLLFPIALIAGVLFHTGTNMVSEYHDYRKGVDRPETYGSSRILVDKLMEPKTVLHGGYVAFAIGFILGMILVYFHGLPMLILGLVGLLGGLLYTGGPAGYKYFALGDLLVFIMMGPLMVVGGYLAVTGEFNMNVLYISLPVGFLVAAILCANNIRDIIHDTQASIKTMASVLGMKRARGEYYFLVISAFLSIIVMVVLGVLEPWALLPLLSFPPALKNLKEMAAGDVSKPETIAMLDIKTAQHHMLFGLLLSVGLILSAIF